VKDRLKSFSMRKVFSYIAMANYACGLLLNPAKAPNFQFNQAMMVVFPKKKSKNLKFERAPLAYGHDPATVLNFEYLAMVVLYRS
jgi:hypothetical protein